jgi:GR25 family glycosyltransferase involved in LPS biosynthesis
MDNIAFYCINFFDEERKNRMIHRFSTMGLELEFVPPVFEADSRILEHTRHLENEKIDKRVWSIMLQHLDSIRSFYENTEKEYLILCEDDIFISKHLKTDLPAILTTFNELQLDVLLLGYLLDCRLERHPENYPTIPNNSHFSYLDFPILKTTDPYMYYDFPYHVWGSQMYLIHRKHALFLLEKYTMEYATADLGRPYNPDWTLTKDGKKAIVYPMLAVEEGVSKSDHDGQNSFHDTCFRHNYDESLHF